MQWLFVAAQALALIRLAWIGFPCRWFLAMLAWGALQAVNVNLAKPTVEWTRTWWLSPEAVLIALTVAACVESIARGQQFVADPFRRLLLRVASIGFPACIVGALAYFVAPPVGDSLAIFVQVRAWIWAYCAVSMIVVELLLAMDAETGRPRWLVIHSLLLLAVMMAHVPVSRLAELPNDGMWRLLRAAVYRPILIACCVGWLLMFRGDAASPRVRGEGHRFP